jgi:hypothetical protein
MSLDFTEIPEAHKKSVGGRMSDSFEFFAESFLRAIGYKIVEGPGRGADGGRDLIVAEVSSLSGAETRWLVTCKHKAHSGAAVSSRDEENLHNRVKKAKCRGLLWFYSTIPTEELKKDFVSLEDDGYLVTGFSYGTIEEHLLNESRPEMAALARQYLPKSYKAWKDASSVVNACLTFDDLKALAALRFRHTGHEILLRTRLKQRGVSLHVAPWVWSEIYTLAVNPKTERMYDDIKDVVNFYGITQFHSALTLIAHDLYNAAPTPRPPFESYVRDIQRIDLDKFVKHVERHLKNVQSKSSLVHAIGEILGLKDAEIKGLEAAQAQGTLQISLKRQLEALEPSAQLVSALLVDNQLSEGQKRQRACAALAASNMPNTVKSHQGPLTARYTPPATLDQRVFNLLRAMASEWIGLPLDMTCVKVQDVRTKFPHIRSMLGYLFGEGRGFRPLKQLIDAGGIDLTKTIFYLIYAPDCQYMSVTGHRLAARLKYGLGSITCVSERDALWSKLLQNDDGSLDGLLAALKGCYVPYSAS